ncbi:Uncharacterised protein [Mycobacteroides abscessus subsp. abscessus]|nr:Uncharacterised protein [Mycobacteroides abscessus subsp. abscessus]
MPNNIPIMSPSEPISDENASSAIRLASGVSADVLL